MRIEQSLIQRHRSKDQGELSHLRQSQAHHKSNPQRHLDEQTSQPCQPCFNQYYQSRKCQADPDRVQKHLRLQKHANRNKEDTAEVIAQWKNIENDLVIVFGLRNNHSGNQGSHSKGQTHFLRCPSGGKNDKKYGQREVFFIANTRDPYQSFWNDQPG